MTWTEENNEAFQEEMSARYRKLADKYGCKVAPVGEKWWPHIHEHPEIDLYFEDRRHASVDGSRLAAQTMKKLNMMNMYGQTLQILLKS